MDCTPIVYAVPVQTTAGPRAVFGLGVLCAVKKNLLVSFGASASDSGRSLYAGSHWQPQSLGPNKVQFNLSSIPASDGANYEKQALHLTYRLN